MKRKGDVTRDDSQRRFLASHSVATVLRHCFEWLQHCSKIATLCCAKNRCFKSSRLFKHHLKTSKFHVVVVQQPQRNIQKSVMHVQRE